MADQFYRDTPEYKRAVRLRELRTTLVACAAGFVVGAGITWIVWLLLKHFWR